MFCIFYRKISISLDSPSNQFKIISIIVIYNIL